MTDQEDRERESRADPETHYEEALEEERAEREHVAAELEREGPLRSADDR
jgi:hypothetical protein